MGYKEGIERLEKIKKFLTQWGAADRDTLELLFFPSRARSQAVLTNLTKQKHLNRIRIDQYIYMLPGYKGDPSQDRQKAQFHATTKQAPSFWKITYQDGIYKCVHTFDQKGIDLRPVFEGEQPGPGATFTAYYDQEGLPRADSLKEALKFFYKTNSRGA